MWGRKKILLIEDIDSVSKVLKSRLKAHNYDVLIEKDGEKGLETAKKKKPDLVITDLALPKINGHVVVRELKSSPEHKHIPIIMLSAFIDQYTGSEKTLKADAYLPKARTTDQLLTKIEEMIGKA